MCLLDVLSIHHPRVQDIERILYGDGSSRCIPLGVFLLIVLSYPQYMINPAMCLKVLDIVL